MIVEQIAVLIYGVLAMVVALVLAVMAGSQSALGLLFLAAGATYLFQVVQVMAVDGTTYHAKQWWMFILWFGSIALSCASVVVSIWD